MSCNDPGVGLEKPLYIRQTYHNKQNVDYKRDIILGRVSARHNFVFCDL